MGELVYTFAATAARHNDGVTCINGMRLLADTLHPLGVPITWFVSPESARIAARELTSWHDRHGDDVALATPDLTEGMEARLKGALDAKKAQLAEARDAVQEALPWAHVTIAAGNHQDPDIARILEALDFDALWGFCWEQIEVDAITDRGCPWGLYYMHPGDRLRPAPGRGVIAMEWTARDLLKAFHSGNPCLYSTDPNDVARGSICGWQDISYWEGLADNYLRNARYNDQVILLQHQEAHEMERHEGWLCYTEEDIRESAVMLDAFVRHIKPHATIMTLAEAARAYRARNEYTASSYMLWEDTPHPPLNRDYAWNTCPGPWPKTFLYYDRGAQMMFVENRADPVCIRNYARPWDTMTYYAEPRLPRSRLVKNTQYAWDREIEIRVESPKAMPYGLCLWGDYSLYQIAEAPGLLEGKILPHELLFLRYDLDEGENTLHVRLRGK